MKNPIILIIIVSITLITFLGAIYLSSNSTNKQLPATYNQVLPSDHVTWNPQAKNILIIYSDFQCPACATLHAFIEKEIQTASSASDIRSSTALVFRHYPLYQIHANAFDPATAAESAGKQGKFFEMISLLFSTQSEWVNKPEAEKHFISLAKKLNLDISLFEKDRKIQEVKNKIDSDIKSAEKAGISYTPTVYLNGSILELTTFSDLLTALRSPKK